MFGGLKNLASMASLMGQAGGMQEKIAAAKERVSAIEVAGIAGGDAITVRMTGDFRVTSVIMHPWLIESKDQNLMQNLIAEATNNAIHQAKEMAAREMASIAEGMNIPGLQDAMAKMGMG